MKKILSLLLTGLILFQGLSSCILNAQAAFDDGIVKKSAAKGIPVQSLDPNDINNTQEMDDSVYEFTDNKPQIKSTIVGEVEELRSETTKHFLKSDGTYVVAMYNEPVHYKDDNGEWKDIDISLFKDTDTKGDSGNKYYSTNASANIVKVPDKITEDSIIIDVDDKEVKMKLCNANKDDVQQNNNTESSSVKIDNSKENDNTETKNTSPMTLKNTKSKATYLNVLPDTDIEYLISSGKVKENIIIKKKQSDYNYDFLIDFDGLKCVESDDGSIKIYDDKNVLKAMLTVPFMFDASGEYSNDVSMSINGSVLTISANKDWINNSDRAFPVTIDPTVVTYISDFEDAYVASSVPNANYNIWLLNHVGCSNSSTVDRIYMKFDIPTLPENSVVTNASLSISQSTTFNNDTQGQSKYFIAYDLTNKPAWAYDTITWNNQPVSSSINGPQQDKNRIIDYSHFDRTSNHVYEFNITKVVKQWFNQPSLNNGIMIASNDETIKFLAWLYSYQENMDESPIIEMSYNQSSGLEDYWSYDNTSADKSGEIYVNNYTGNLTYVHDDIDLSGNLLPIKIQHIYNNNSDNTYNSIYSTMKTGQKFRLNVQESLKMINSTESLYALGYRYKYYDSDGTLHYFCTKTIDGVTKITDEYNSNIELTSSGANRIITDEQGNKKYFYVLGKLLKYEDKNGNIQTITYENIHAKQIKKITDAAGREVIFNYNSSNQLISLVDPSGRSIEYQYSDTTENANLIEIKYPDNKTTSFEYTDGALSKVTKIDNGYITCQYYSTAYGKKVKNIKEYNKDSSNQISQSNTKLFTYIQSSSLEQITGDTVITDQNNDFCAYKFDDYGRCCSITDNYGKSIYSSYGSDAENNANTFNKLLSCNEKSISQNSVYNHGFELTNGWSALQQINNCTFGYDSTVSKYGNRSLKLSTEDSTSAVEVDQDIDSFSSFETYSLSVDVYIPEEINVNGTNGATFGLVYCLGGNWVCKPYNWISHTNGWERFSFTIKIPNGVISNCHVFMKLYNAEGTVYFDNIQLEKGGDSGLYNLVDNSDFSLWNYNNNTPTYLKAWGFSGTPSECSSVNYNGRDYYEIYGNSAQTRRVSQVVYVNADAGETLVFGCIAAANAINDSVKNCKFSLKLNFIEDRTVFNSIELEFDKSIRNDFQTIVSSYVLPQHCNRIGFIINYDYQVCSAFLSDAFIYIGTPGTQYQYNSDGLVSEERDEEGKVINYEYEDCDVTEVTQTTNGVENEVATYEYDNNHNVSKVTNNDGTSVEYQYLNGVVTNKTTKSSDNTVLTTESMTYIQNGNYLKTYTDVNGETTTYYYDNNDSPIKGLIETVQEPNGNEIHYSYDSNDYLLSVEGEPDALPASDVETEFGYQNDRLTSITHNGVVYSQTYNEFNQVTNSKINNQSIISTTYDNHQRVSQISYANGKTYVPSYDSKNRLDNETWNNNQISEYYYDENDRVVQLDDMISNVQYRYDYALYDLPFRVMGSDGSKSQYDYDSTGKLTKQSFYVNDDLIYNAKYKNNEKGNPEDVIIDTFDNTLIHYNYDDLSRLTDYSTGPVITTLTYNQLSGSIGDRISVFKNEDRNDNILQQYNYTYDENSNITGVTETVSGQTRTYTYDGIERLISESDGTNTYTYLYDNGGNITAVKLNGATQHSYVYGNSNWNDQLTSFDGKTITYDLNGNPTSYDGKTYTWQRNNLLTSISGNNTSISYVYDAQGRRIQKTVNNVVTDYTYSEDMLISQTTGNNTIYFVYDSQGSAIGFKYNNDVYYYLKNQLGDITAIADSDGVIVAAYSYDAYGNILSSTGTLANINPYRYRGYYQDNETGYYYLKARYYNPEWRRFINADILFVSGDLLKAANMFAYANDNPIAYVDTDGYSPEENIRRTSKIASILIWPITKSFFKFANKRVLPVAKLFGGKDFATSLIAQKVMLPAVNSVRTEYFAKWGGDRTNHYKTGLRHIFFANMKLGAPWAGYFLGFERSTYKNYLFFKHDNYTTVEGKYMWQSEVGYTWIYDWGFSLGGPIQRLMMKFKYNNTPYIIWCWKADYWNLGAGAEIGIYYAESQELADKNYYEIDTNLTVHAHMQIVYDYFGVLSYTLNDFHQTNWWITSFTPMVQHANIDWLHVTMDVRFVNNPSISQYSANYNNMMKPFYSEWFEYRNEVDKDWHFVSMLPYAHKTKPTGHANHPMCNLHPAKCTCVCPTHNQACAEPCSYYTTKCTSSDNGCQHYNDSDNGFQFRIEY